MLLHVWEDYVEKGDDSIRKDEELDVQEMEDAFDNVHAYDEDFDYDPFQDDPDDTLQQPR